MKKILIAYADENMQYSTKLLALEARLINVFDKIIMYSPDMLPEYIKKSPLMKYKCGGGYWVWKPCIIWETLQKFEDGDIVCYIDAGCTLHPGKQWNEYFDLLKFYDTLCFQYKDVINEWKSMGQTCSKVKFWTKKKTLLFFDEYLNTTEYRDFNKVLGGIIFCKNKNNDFVKDWLDITIDSPQLIIDPSEEEKNDQYDFFSGYHRHDQSIITPLTYKYVKKSVYILPEQFDEVNHDSIIVATRYRITTKKIYKKLFFYYIMHYWKDKKIYQYIKNLYYKNK